MALDPQVCDLLNMIAAAGNQPMWEQTPQEARAGLAALIALGGPAEELVPPAVKGLLGTFQCGSIDQALRWRCLLSCTSTAVAS